MHVDVQRITDEQVGTVCDASADAFMDEPAMCFVLRGERRRRRYLRGYFRQLVEFARARGEAYTTSEAEGVALWIRPPGHSALYSAVWTAPGLLATGFCLWPGEFWRAQFIGAHILELDRAGFRAPHYYLWMLAVRPDRQRGGIGGALLAPGFEMADRAGAPCALTTASQANVAFYEKQGFAVRGARKCPFGGPMMWAMRREPAAASPRARDRGGTEPVAAHAPVSQGANCKT